MTGAGIVGLGMLQQQLGNYEEIFANTANSVKENMNKVQQDINRDFTPVIKDAMTGGYDRCTQESGKKLSSEI